MTTINSTERPASEPELTTGETQSEAPRRSGFSGRLMAAVVAVVAVITGGVFWLLAGTGGNEPQQPVQVVQDDGNAPGQQFGSADSLEHQAGSGTQYGSADSLEHHAAPQAQ